MAKKNDRGHDGDARRAKPERHTVLECFELRIHYVSFSRSARQILWPSSCPAKYASACAVPKFVGERVADAVDAQAQDREHGLLVFLTTRVAAGRESLRHQLIDRGFRCCHVYAMECEAVRERLIGCWVRV